MTVEYDYQNKTKAPNLEGIHSGVAASGMTDKDIDSCLWNESDSIIRVFWVRELSTDDKIALDSIVEANS